MEGFRYRDEVIGLYVVVQFLGEDGVERPYLGQVREMHLKMNDDDDGLEMLHCVKFAEDGDECWLDLEDLDNENILTWVKKNRSSSNNVSPVGAKRNRNCRNEGESGKKKKKKSRGRSDLTTEAARVSSRKTKERESFPRADASKEYTIDTSEEVCDSESDDSLWDPLDQGCEKPSRRMHVRKRRARKGKYPETIAEVTGVPVDSPTTVQHFPERSSETPPPECVHSSTKMVQARRSSIDSSEGVERGDNDHGENQLLEAVRGKHYTQQSTLTRPRNKKGRGNYKCGRCGAPKKGHVCFSPE